MFHLQGRIPGFIVSWHEYLRGLTPTARPSYEFLEHLLDNLCPEINAPDAQFRMVNLTAPGHAGLKRGRCSAANTSRDSLYSECATRVQDMPAKKLKVHGACAALEDSLMLGSLPAIEE